MKWDLLLSKQKLAREEAAPSQFRSYPINDFEIDYNKIVSSAAFRRLQDKTQVFPLDKSDFVRTRLTHSIEVSTIARQLGIMISKNTTGFKSDDIGDVEAEGISSVLLCAGLLHDLGNPPFGHFGETVIGEWFKNNLKNLRYRDNECGLDKILTPQMVKDLECFEGNAQALRILAKARHDSEINLSAAVISTLVKYPTISTAFNKKDADIKKHKPGCFFAEYATFTEVSKMVGTVDESGDICRHPLTFLLEAADDIAYVTADLEDAFKKGLFSLNEFIGFLRDCFSEINAPYAQRVINDLAERQEQQRKDPAANKSQIFADWVTFTRRWLMYSAVYSFSRNYDEIMQGTYKNDLFYGTYHEDTIRIMKKDVMRKFVFNSTGILKLELSSQTILNFLLREFVDAVIHFDTDSGKLTSAHEKYLNIFSDNYKNDYVASRTGDEVTDLYLRLLMVTDYISGMTDTYARTLYRELSGIE